VALDGIYSEHYAGREPDYRDPRRALATAYNNSGNELLPLLKLDQQERDPRYLARRLMYGDDYSGSMNTAVNKIKKPYEAVRTNTFRKGECYAVMVWYLDGKVGDHKLSHTYLCMVENGVRINNDTVILRTHSKTRYYLKEDGLYKGPDDAKTEAQGKIQIIQLKPPGLN
jgi:hypothetical protein